jgi:TRAP-type C4-dicarboxylate transport system substrate-binding protein
MQGLKFRIASSEIRQITFDTLNAPAIPMAFAELFTGLQQGVVDGQENPLSVIITGKFYEVQKYLSMSRHIYNTATFLVNPDFFQSLTKEQQTVIREEADLARDLMRELNDQVEKEALEELKAKGMQINEIDKAAFIQAVQPVWNFFREKYGSELIDMALSAQ